MSSELEGFKAVLYARVSTNDKGQTNETQIREMKRWCKEKGVVIIPKDKENIAFADEQTGTNLDRPNFQLMLGKIVSLADTSARVDFVLAYDQSRLTRDAKYEDIKKKLDPFGCKIRFVTMDGDPDDIGMQISNAVQGLMNKREVETIRAKTKLALETRKLAGKHVSRPASFMFAEDVLTAPKGRCNITDDKKIKTVVVPEETVYGYARAGLSMRTTAHLIGVSPSVFIYEMKLADPNDPKHRNKGRIDRYTKYNELYEYALRVRKGECSETVGNGGEKCSETVGVSERVVTDRIPNTLTEQNTENPDFSSNEE